MMRRTWDRQTDRYWGPLTYNTAPRSYHPVGVVLESAGDGEDDDAYGGSGCAALRLSGFGRTLILALPGWVLRPWRRRVYPGWDAEVVARLGRDWYWDVHERKYGLSLSSSGSGERLDYLQVFLGRQTHDSSTTQQWSKFLPWATDRHVRHSYYNQHGHHYYTEPQPSPRYGTPEDDARREAVAGVPCRYYAFRDFDGEQLYARARVEEREWRRGEGWFKWLSWFCKPLVIRRLNLDFSGETGERKGSWKGGTLSTNGPVMVPGERHDSAFLGYAVNHKMTDVREVAREDLPADCKWRD